jgi:N-methylhydantoinase B
MVTVAPGETIVSVSCGGGGYGPPQQREPARVAHDVAERWISADRARTVYGAKL